MKALRLLALAVGVLGAQALFGVENPPPSVRWRSDLLDQSDGFVPLFDGTSLNGWTNMHKRGSPYYVTNGVIASPADTGDDLVTEKSYSDFILQMDFKLTAGANNGVGIRTPLEKTDLTYSGNEIQILDDDDAQYAHLDPGQYCGSLYRLLPAKRGALNKVGEWNHYEITAIGRHIMVVLNGKTIVDGDVNGVSNAKTLRQHPGAFRTRGHIALLGHRSYVEFKNIRVRDLSNGELVAEIPADKAAYKEAPDAYFVDGSPDNRAPDGFTALFNGHDLTDWKGLVENPPKRAVMTPEALAAAQVKADQRMRDHWKAKDGVIVFDGKGENLCTAQDYGDFEMLVDWKIPAKGDSGIYIRGTPQVQIWETNSPGQFAKPDGSGALWNNQKNPRQTLVYADNPVGKWNRFRIVMIGEKVHVYLNNQLVTRDTTLENYWEPAKPIYKTGQIELQNHGGPLWFKNIYIRRLPTESEAQP